MFGTTKGLAHLVVVIISNYWNDQQPKRQMLTLKYRQQAFELTLESLLQTVSWLRDTNECFLHSWKISGPWRLRIHLVKKKTPQEGGEDSSLLKPIKRISAGCIMFHVPDSEVTRYLISFGKYPDKFLANSTYFKAVPSQKTDKREGNGTCGAKPS